MRSTIALAILTALLAPTLAFACPPGGGYGRQTYQAPPQYGYRAYGFAPRHAPPPAWGKPAPKPTPQVESEPPKPALPQPGATQLEATPTSQPLVPAASSIPVPPPPPPAAPENSL